MTDIAGNVNYYVRLSTAQSSGPSGNILYLYAEDYNKSFKDGMMSKQSVGGRSYRYPNGKRAISVDLKNCYITAQQTASATSELAAIENFFILIRINPVQVQFIYLLKTWPIMRMLNWLIILEPIRSI